jgi:hypothetical protein
MIVRRRILVLAMAAAAGALAHSADALGQSGTPATLDEILRELNSGPIVEGTVGSKSYELLFDAYLEMSTPPFPVGPGFNHSSIHPGMSAWSQVADWAESNPGMKAAILAARDRTILGLPYGRRHPAIKPAYERADLVADIGAGGSLRNLEFPYLYAVDGIAAYATAEAYRLLEQGESEEGLKLMLAHLFVARQLCDREFLGEKLHSIEVLLQALSNLRDMFYRYQDQITAEEFTRIATEEVPYLRPDRNALLMPEGDLVVSRALIKEVFNRRGEPDAEKFAGTFGEIQAAGAPLTRFGAARRWELIAAVHGSLVASLERLQLVYDDWWRRWRVQEYDPILEVATQFARTNEIRYAAVIHSMQNIEELFVVRRQLIAAVNGTAVAAGLCAYRRTFGTYPVHHRMAYAQFVRKSSDVDPWDQSYGPLLYILTSERHAIDTPQGRIWVEPGEAIVYSRGQSHADERATQHTDNGVNGDIVIWPPLRELSRRQSLID